MLVELQDGRVFPTYGEETLAWNIGLYMTLTEERLGFPRAKAVITAMRVYRPDQLSRERSSALRGSFDKIFGRASAQLLKLIDESNTRERL
jgi:hypothetical protein